MGQRNVLVKARNIDSNVVSFIKIRYQLNPRDFGFDDDDDEIIEIAEDHFCQEVKAMSVLYQAGLAPGWTEYKRRCQPEWMPFTDGYVDLMIMPPPLGENLDDIYEGLTDRQLASIRTQLARMLERMRQNGFKLIQQHPSYLYYDVGTDKLNLVDLAGLGFTDPTHRTSIPIDEESPYVEVFNIWRAPYRTPETGSGGAGKKPSSEKPAPAAKKGSDNQAKKENRPPWRH